MVIVKSPKNEKKIVKIQPSTQKQTWRDVRLNIDIDKMTSDCYSPVRICDRSTIPVLPDTLFPAYGRIQEAPPEKCRLVCGPAIPRVQSASSGDDEDFFRTLAYDPDLNIYDFPDTSPTADIVLHDLSLLSDLLADLATL